MKPAVLLVEDNKINQLVARKVLEKAEFSVDVAASAEEALGLLREKTYKLVLMDVQMPGTDGAEATRLIRSGEADVLDPQVPIVAMTAYTSEDDQLKFAGSGMNGFLSKPLDVDELIDSVRGYVSDNGAVAALDTEELDSRVGGDRELAQEILSAFATGLGQRFSALADAVDADDWREVQMIGHALAGAASNIGASELARFGRDVEAAARERNVTRVRELLGRVEAVSDRFRSAVFGAGYAD
mgnify:CR=1 FL=1